MKNLLFRCSKCNKYTMMEVQCPHCGEATVIAAPAKYSPDDKYARYRSPLAYQAAPAEQSSASK